MDGAIFMLPWGNLIEGLAVLLRCSAFVAAAPVLGAVQIPARARMGLALLLSFSLAPSVETVISTSSVILLVAGECLAGLVIGLSLRFAVDAAIVAGSIAGSSTGLALATTLDPVTSVATPTLSQFNHALVLLVYLAIGGHRLLLGALAKSFEILTPGAVTLEGPWLPAVISMTGRSIELGVRIAAPVIVAGLVVDLVLMLIARAAPQMHILIVGAPIRVAAGLVAVGLAIHFLLTVVEQGVDGSILDVGRFLRALSVS